MRINPKFGYISNFYGSKSNSPMVRSMNGPCRGIYRPSALLGYEHVPGYGTSNSYGLAGKEYSLKKNDNTFRILLLGDSIAEQDFSRQFLEGNLNSNSALNSRYKFEIWNAGVGGYDVHHYYLYLKHKGLDYKPDMVIVFFCLNDFTTSTSIYYKNKDGITEYYFPTREVSKRYTVTPLLMRKSYLYRFLVLRLDSYLLGRKKILGTNPAEEDGRYYLQMIKEICDRHKIRLFVVIFPYLKPLDEYDDYEIQEYKTICKVIKELKINYINLYERLPERDLYNLRNIKEDKIHPSQEGQHLVANIVYDYLLNSFFKK